MLSSLFPSSALQSPLRTAGVSKVESFCGHLYFYDGLVAFCDLSLPDLLLDDQPQTALQLAKAQGWNASRLYRLLRQMTFADVVSVAKEAAPDADAASTTEFTLTDDGRLLRSTHPSKCRAMLLLTAAPMIRYAMGQCAAIIREPSDAYTRGDVRYIATQPGGPHPAPFVFMQLPANAAQGRVFNDAMSAYSRQEADSILAHYSAFSSFHTVVDVGGGFGTLGCAIAKAHPTIASVVEADLAPVIAGAQQRNDAAAMGVGDRVRFAAIDFLDPTKLTPVTEAVRGAVALGKRACLLLKHVLHDWDDETAIKILKHLRGVVGEVEGAGALVTLAVVEEHFEVRASTALQPQDWFVCTMDVLMMAVTGGKQRTKAEWERLFAASGWQWKDLVSCRVNSAQIRAVSVLEAVAL